MNLATKTRNRMLRRHEAIAKQRERLSTDHYPTLPLLSDPKQSRLTQNEVYMHNRCADCNSADMELDKVGGYWVCCQCGLVSTQPYCSDGVNNTEFRYRESAPYNFLYHFNEVWSAYKGGGPPVEDIDMAAIRLYLCRTRISVFTATYYRKDPLGQDTLNPFFMERPHWHQLCKDSGFPPLAERWVQIKRRLLPHSFRMPYPSGAEEIALRIGFERWARAFTKRFYTTGKRRTEKDNIICNSGLLCRHNMPHYSWIVQNIAHYLDPSLRWRCELDKYFPLQKTPAVIRRLQLIWIHVCHDLGWELSILSK